MLEQEIKLQGSLSEVSVPQIFHSLSVSRTTGIFGWSFGSIAKKVFIQNGRIVFAYSNRREERLGEVLFRRGMIRAADFIEASKKISEKKRLGQILIEMGALAKEQIKAGIIEQVREIIFSLFNESQGDYSFQEQESLPKEVITLDINTPELILGGVQRISDWDLILQTLSGIDTILEPSANAEKKRVEIPLSEPETRVLTLVNGENTVQDICSAIGGNDFQTCRTLMAFLCANLIRKISSAEIAVVAEKKSSQFFEKTIRCYNRLYSYVYRYLGEKVGKLGDKNLSHYLEEIKGDYPALFKGIFLMPDGTLAGEVLKENFDRLPEAQRKEKLLSGLKTFLSAELAATRESLGATEESFVISRLKEIMEGMKQETVK
jgi:hypothetical protein